MVIMSNLGHLTDSFIGPLGGADTVSNNDNIFA